MKRKLVVFSGEDAESIRLQIKLHLPEAPPEKTETFIRWLDFACQDYKYFLRQNQAAQAWHEIEGAIPALKAALGVVKKIEREGAPVANMGGVPGTAGRAGHFIDEEKSLKAFFECSVLARDAVEALSPLVKHLEELQPPRPPRGRPQNEAGFAQAVADIYREVFEEQPTKKRDGALAQVLAVCLESMGLPSEDPARRLRKIKQGQK